MKRIGVLVLLSVLQKEECYRPEVVSSTLYPDYDIVLSLKPSLALKARTTSSENLRELHSGLLGMLGYFKVLHHTKDFTNTNTLEISHRNLLLCQDDSKQYRTQHEKHPVLIFFLHSVI